LKDTQIATVANFGLQKFSQHFTSFGAAPGASAAHQRIVNQRPAGTIKAIKTRDKDLLLLPSLKRNIQIVDEFFCEYLSSRFAYLEPKAARNIKIFKFFNAPLMTSMKTLNGGRGLICKLGSLGQAAQLWAEGLLFVVGVG
jgi:hypothetical protein